MKRSTFIFAPVTIFSAIGVFLLLHSTSNPKTGSMVGIKQASACTTTDHRHDCLPNITFLSTDDDGFPREELAGHVVIINFWATWCRPCLQEIPALASIYSAYKAKKVVMLGILTDDVEATQLKQFAHATGVNYPIVRADDEILAAFGYPSALPTTFVYDQFGKLQLAHRGQIHKHELKAALDRLID